MALHKIWADSCILNIFSLIIFGFRADRLLIRLRIFATLLVRKLSLVFSKKFTFFNEHQHWSDTATIPVLR